MGNERLTRGGLFFFTEEEKSKRTFYEKKIVIPEQKNEDKSAKVDAYEKNQSNWESFKNEFNHDIVAVGAALKDLTVDNKK